jgi:metal-dependent amidase/aminoacylase/carboxypeptidase family protein
MINEAFIERIRLKSTELFEKVKGYREHLHRFPELSYQEVETANFVSEQLFKLGIHEQLRLANTGIVAVISGDHHSKNDACFA